MSNSRRYFLGAVPAEGGRFTRNATLMITAIHDFATLEPAQVVGAESLNSVALRCLRDLKTGVTYRLQLFSIWLAARV